MPEPSLYCQRWASKFGAKPSIPAPSLYCRRQAPIASAKLLMPPSSLYYRRQACSSGANSLLPYNAKECNISLRLPRLSSFSKIFMASLFHFSKKREKKNLFMFQCLFLFLWILTGIISNGHMTRVRITYCRPWSHVWRVLWHFVQNKTLITTDFYSLRREVKGL